MPDAAPLPGLVDRPTAVARIEQFIWRDGAVAEAVPEVAPPEVAPPEIAPQETAPRPAPPLADEMALPRIVAPPPAETPTQDERWRRQLISALRDADREITSPPASSAAGPPPLPYVEPPPAPTMPRRRTSPPSLRTRAIEPIAPTPRRHRLGLALLAGAAIAGVLAAALPRTANQPDLAPGTAHAQQVEARVVEAKLQPAMFNAPVLVREGAAPMPPAPPRAPYVIASRPSDASLHNREVPAPVVTVAPPAQALADRPPTPTVAPPPAAFPPPFDRVGLTELVAQPSLQQSSQPPPAPPLPQAKPLPPPATHQQAATEPASREAGTSGRGPQISTSYERSVPDPSKQTRKRSTRRDSKRSARATSPQWDTRRQGLRTAPAPPAEEPTALQKVGKWLWPFSSEEEKPK